MHVGFVRYAFLTMVVSVAVLAENAPAAPGAFSHGPRSLVRPAEQQDTPDQPPEMHGAVHPKRVSRKLQQPATSRSPREEGQGGTTQAYDGAVKSAGTQQQASAAAGTYATSGPPSARTHSSTPSSAPTTPVFSSAKPSTLEASSAGGGGASAARITGNSSSGSGGRNREQGAFTGPEPFPSDGQAWRAGRGTVSYSRRTTNFGAASMACGMAYLNDHFRNNHVAVSSSLFGSGALCGACLRIRCDQDIGCTWVGGLDAVSVSGGVEANSTLFMVVDSCKECGANDVVMSARGYTRVSGLDYNVIPQAFVEWQLTLCAPMIVGGIRMMPAQQTSSFFLGLNFSNTKQLIRGVLIGGIRMAPTTYGYWEIDTPGRRIHLRAPYQLSLLGEAGQVITTQLASLRPQVLDVQFDSP